MGIPVGVIGASGIVGGELTRLILAHPDLELCSATRSDRDGAAPVRLDRLHPHLLDAGADLEVGGTDVADVARRCRAVFLATPAEVSAELVPELLAAGVEVVVDLSPAFRIDRPAVHRRWYPKVNRPAGVDAVYGLPELHRKELTAARVIAAPGCLATAAILGLRPLAELAGAGIANITIDGKAGSTGSGNQVRRSGLHAARTGVIAPYAPVGHRHTGEIRQALTAAGVSTTDGGLRMGMSVFAVDVVRGLSVAAYVTLDRDRRAGRIPVADLFRDFYAGEPFVRVRDWARGAVPTPDPKILVGSNYCDVAAFHDLESDRLIIIAALDNLMKGAAGQAVQACNVRFGLPEDRGLTAMPLYPA